MIPAGNAKEATPASIIIPLNILPATVMGIISPYPTVVNVTTAHQIVAGMLVNAVP